MADQQDAKLWLALALIPGLGAESYRRLLAEFGLPERIFSAPQAQLRTVVSAEIARHIAAGPEQFDLTASLAWLNQPGNHFLTLADPSYPRRLLETADPPPFLFAKGRLELLNQPALAVVGSRNATPQGERDAEAFAEALANAGLCIVSGLALGIDAAAHRGGLRGSGSSIAVVGTGLDIIYPARNRDLAHHLAEKGCVVSEFLLGTPSRAQNFPRRNRIISGLSLGVLVVEAALQSGSLITARLAGEQGREVFAMPGSIHAPMSKGCHRLIKQGAKLVESAADILEELAIPYAQSPRGGAVEAPPDHHNILKTMGNSPVGVDFLVARTGLTANQVSSILLELELAGRVAALPGGLYQALS